MLSKEILDKFKKLYQKKYDVYLTDEETTQMAMDLINLMKILLTPDTPPSNNEEQPEERRLDETLTTL